jgi:hypothetical protein
MDSFATFGRILVILGLSIAAAGGILWLIGRIPGLKDLPGTLHFEGQGFTCIFPLLASIVLSIVLTVVLNLIVRLLNK